MAPRVGICAAPTTLGDVGGDRYGRPPELRGEPEAFLSREARCRPVDRRGVRVRCLPDSKLSEVLHGRRVRPCALRAGTTSARAPSCGFGLWALGSVPPRAQSPEPKAAPLNP